MNAVFAVFGSDTHTRGIYLLGPGGVASNNRVRGLLASGSGAAIGIFAADTLTTVEGNQLIIYNAGLINGSGITGYSNTSTSCSNNVIAGFTTATTRCVDDGTNHPPRPPVAW